MDETQTEPLTQALTPGSLMPPALQLELRAKIQELQDLLMQVPGAMFGNAFPLSHTFVDGIYVRAIFMPKGYVVVGRIHKHAHPNFLMQGEVIVVTEQRGREHLKAPLAMVSPAGTKRALITLEDTVWITVHRTDVTDYEDIEDILTVKDYEAFEAAQAARSQG